MTQVVEQADQDDDAGRPARRAEHHRPAGRWTGRMGAVLAMGVPTGLTGLHALLYGRWIVDDAAITFAYARSIATGAGPVLQPGAEVVEGYSNPAWLAVLTVGRWLGLFDRGSWLGVPDYVTFPKTVALLCCAGMFGCMFAAARAVSRRPVLVTLVAGSVTAAVPSFVIWCFSGLENSLLGLTAVGLAAVLVRAAATGHLLSVRTAAVCGLLAALGALTRPDGVIYVGAFPLAALLLLRRENLHRAVAASVISVAAFALPAGGYLAWRMWTFGEYLPNTALAKSQGLPGSADLARPGELVGYVGWLAALLAVMFIGAALARPSRVRRGLSVLLVPFGLAVTAFGVLEADWMGQYRFATPVWPLGALAGTLAAAYIVPQLATRGRAAVAVLAAAAAVVSGLALADTAREFRAAPTAPLCLVAQNTGRNINGYAEIVGLPDATLLAPDIGGAAMTSDLRIIDLAGLADARIGGYWHDQDWAGLRDYLFDEIRPTFIKSHGAWSTTTGLTSDPRMAADYVEIGSTAGTADWVRRDALGSPAKLAELRAYTTDVAAPADAQYREAPRASCGAL
jgi:hypothetical protein